MKVLLVNPPTNHEHIPENPFLGLLYLASVLRKKHDVWVIDFDALKYDWKQIRQRLLAEKPDVVGITCTTITYKNMLRMCKLIRKNLPSTKIIIGGPHVTAKPEESLRESKADFVIVGEGELALKQILKNLDGKEKIIWGKPIENLDNIPLPARDLLEPPINYYSGNLPRHLKPETVMLWSRGCPHNCLFCSNPIYKKQKPRFRSPENILKELKELKKMGIKEVFVYDDELVGMSEEQNKWLEKICKLIIKEKLGLVFKCQGRCSKFVSIKTLNLMKEAGFKTIMWGCESGSDAVLKAIRKGISTTDIEKTIKLCKEAGIETWMFLIVGNYRETVADAEKTVKLVQRCRPDFVQATYATPYPSDFEKICIEKNYIIEQDRSKWNTNIPVIETEYMEKKEVERYRNKILNSQKVQKISKGQIKQSPFKKGIIIVHQTYKNLGFRPALKKFFELAWRFLSENTNL